VVGRVSLPRPYSEPGIRNQPARTRKTLLRLQLFHPWDFRTKILNPRSRIPLNSSRWLSQSQKLLPDPLSLSLRPSASQADFTIADASDDESSHDPATVTPHDNFYLDERSVEVLCGNTLFRVHASTLSFHSPVLSQMFAKSNLETAESPNGCPRILSSDTATDFATLLKVIYLPVYATLPLYRSISLLTPSSTDSLNGIKPQISRHSHPSSE